MCDRLLFLAHCNSAFIPDRVLGLDRTKLGAGDFLIAMGLTGGVAQILVTSSYRFGQASMLAPYDYTTMLFANVGNAGRRSPGDRG